MKKLLILFLCSFCLLENVVHAQDVRLEWARSMGAGYLDQGRSITTDALGNVYTTGFFYFTVDFDPLGNKFNLTSNGFGDAFILKLDALGRFSWAKSMGWQSSTDGGSSITIDTLGNVYTTGSYKGTVDFDPGASTFNLTSNGNYDAFVQKLDANGNFIWAKSIGGPFAEYGGSITTNENVYITGSYQGTVDFDPGADTFNLTSNGNVDLFVQKLDTAGNFIWAGSMGGVGSDYGRSITTDTSGNLYITGTYAHDPDFDPGPNVFTLSRDDGALFILKLDAGGNFIWAKSIGSSNPDEAYSITSDISGNVYLTGSFEGTADFDPSMNTFELTSEGYSDIFILKLGPCAPSTGTDIVTACDSYTWIDGTTYTASNNTATVTFTNAAGCDSVVTLNLRVTIVDVGVNVTASTLTASATPATYQWLDCSNNHAVILGETNQNFTPSRNGNYAVEVTQNGCTDTSACYLTTGGILQNDFGESLSIFPNPTTGRVHIDLGQSYSEVKITIRNMSGQLIQAKNYETAQKMEVEIEGSSAYYLIEISTGEGRSASLKIFKE